jgi:polyisoprenoid-binding protein YceI
MNNFTRTRLFVSTTIAAASLLSLQACSEGKTEPSPGAAATTEPAKADPVKAPTLVVPPGALGFSASTGSTLGFHGKKITGKHDGTFERFEGFVKLDGNMLGGVEIAIDVASVKTDSAKLDGHLRSPDFFDVATHPTARFVSTAIEEGGDGGEPTHIVVGDFTLRGVTKSLRVPVKVALTPTMAAAKGEITINRQDFGVTYPGKPDDLIADDVSVRFDVRAPRPASADKMPVEPVEGAATK